jgi:hypothetical protein
LTRTCRRCGESFETDRAHHRLCWPCYWEVRDGDAPPRRDPPPPAAPALDERLLRDAIQLCHPDRHPPERARIAYAVTAPLLEHLAAASRTA